MDLHDRSSGSRFSAYVEGLVSVLGHADRTGPLRDYRTGLLMPVERKSVEPLAAVTAPERTAAQHQSLLHFVGEGRWLVWLTSSRHTLHRRLRIPGLRKGDDSPLRHWLRRDLPNASAFRRL